MVYELRPYNSVSDWNEEESNGVIVWETDEPMDLSAPRICGKLVAYLGFRGKGEFHIPEGITSIGFRIFEKSEWECFDPYVEVLHIPASVETIEEGAFMGAWLTDVVIHPDSPCGMVKDKGLYTKDGKTLLYVLELDEEGEEDVYTVPDGVTRVAFNAFGPHMGTLVLPASVTEIGYDDNYDYLYSNLTIRAPKGSYALQFAEEHDIECEEL